MQYNPVAVLFRRKKFDYARLHAEADYARDYWSVVGPATREEFEALGPWKLALLRESGLTEESRVLDVGCGTGLLTRVLEPFLSDGAHYVGTDIAAQALDFCRARFRRPNFRFLRGEMRALPEMPEAFDAICFFSVFTHTYPDETALLLADAARRLALGGFIVADCFLADCARRYRGDRAAIEIGADHHARLLRETGLAAEVVHSVRLRDDLRRDFLRLVPHSANNQALPRL